MSSPVLRPPAGLIPVLRGVAHCGAAVAGAVILTACPSPTMPMNPGSSGTHGVHGGPPASRVDPERETTSEPAAAGTEAAHGGHASTADAHHHGHYDKRFQDAEAWSAVFDDAARDTWQRPDEVIAALVPRDDLAIADIGAGTGYFAVRFARAVPKGRVFGVDIEASMAAHLTERAAKEGLTNLEAHVAPPDDASLGALGRPLDLVFVCNTYHHIANRSDYFRSVRSHLAAGGRLAIVDYRLDAHRGPPPEHRLSEAVVEAELAEAGFKRVATHDFLPDQYVLVFE